MFSEEELQIMFRVFKNLESEEEKEIKLKKKMSLLEEQMKISKEANEKLREIDNEIRSLYEENKDENKKAEE